MSIMWHSVVSSILVVGTLGSTCYALTFTDRRSFEGHGVADEVDGYTGRKAYPSKTCMHFKNAAR